MAHMRTFSFVPLVLRDLPMETGKIVGICHTVSVIHFVILGNPSKVFTWGKNGNFW